MSRETSNLFLYIFSIKTNSLNKYEITHYYRTSIHKKCDEYAYTYRIGDTKMIRQVKENDLGKFRRCDGTYKLLMFEDNDKKAKELLVNALLDQMECLNDKIDEIDECLDKMDSIHAVKRTNLNGIYPKK